MNTDGQSADPKYTRLLAIVTAHRERGWVYPPKAGATTTEIAVWLYQLLYVPEPLLRRVIRLLSPRGMVLERSIRAMVYRYLNQGTLDA
jgi:hypothetical protein